MIALKVTGFLRDDSTWSNRAWAEYDGAGQHCKRVVLTAIPYALRADRSPSTMRIFVGGFNWSTCCLPLLGRVLRVATGGCCVAGRSGRLRGGTPGQRDRRNGAEVANSIVHAEVTGADPDGLRAFYGDLFGWSASPGAPVASAVSQAKSYALNPPGLLQVRFPSEL